MDRSESRSEFMFHLTSVSCRFFIKFSFSRLCEISVSLIDCNKDIDFHFEKEVYRFIE